MEKRKVVKKVRPRITYGEYYLQHSEHAPTRFDVMITGRRAALCYGSTLPNAMEHIAMHKLSLKTEDRSLKEFITEFKGLIHELKIALDTPYLMQG